MATTINLPADKLANYLNVAYKQRERAAKQFSESYGPNSAPAIELAKELAEINAALLELKQIPTKK